jgi:hypothetical protein
MTAAALARYPNAKPWRMSALDYRSAAGTGQPLLGTPAATPWDPQLQTQMRAAGQSVMEERLMATLLADLRADQPGGSSGAEPVVPSGRWSV